MCSYNDVYRSWCRGERGRTSLTKKLAAAPASAKNGVIGRWNYKSSKGPLAGNVPIRRHMGKW